MRNPVRGSLLPNAECVRTVMLTELFSGVKMSLSRGKGRTEFAVSLSVGHLFIAKSNNHRANFSSYEEETIHVFCKKKKKKKNLSRKPGGETTQKSAAR